MLKSHVSCFHGACAQLTFKSIKAGSCRFSIWAFCPIEGAEERLEKPKRTGNSHMDPRWQFFSFSIMGSDCDAKL